MPIKTKRDDNAIPLKDIDAAFGRAVYLVGGYAKAARHSGINAGLVKISAIAIMGALMAIGGRLLAPQIGSARGSTATGWNSMQSRRRLLAVPACWVAKVVSPELLLACSFSASSATARLCWMFRVIADYCARAVDCASDAGASACHRFVYARGFASRLGQGEILSIPARSSAINLEEFDATRGVRLPNRSSATPALLYFFGVKNLGANPFCVPSSRQDHILERLLKQGVIPLRETI